MRQANTNGGSPNPESLTEPTSLGLSGSIAIDATISDEHSSPASLPAQTNGPSFSTDVQASPNGAVSNDAVTVDHAATSGAALSTDATVAAGAGSDWTNDDGVVVDATQDRHVSTDVAPDSSANVSLGDDAVQITEVVGSSESFQSAPSEILSTDQDTTHNGAIGLVAASLGSSVPSVNLQLASGATTFPIGSATTHVPTLSDATSQVAPSTTNAAATTTLAVFGDLGNGPVNSAGSGSGVNGAAPGSSGATTISYTTPGSGLVFKVVYDYSPANLPAGLTSAIQQVATYYESHFTNAQTVTIDVGYGEIDGHHMGAGALGESEAYLTSVPYAELRTALVKSLDASGNTAAAASLPATSPVSSNVWVTTAEANALGIAHASTPVDGYVGFSSKASFAYNDSNGVPANDYDFTGVVAHEFSEVMGRTMMDGQTFNGSAGYEPLDLFHYSASGVRDFSGTTAGYASQNGGKTDLNNFNTNPGGDFGDWAPSAGNNSYDAYSNPGVVNSVTYADLKLMNLLGWNSPSQPAGSPSTVIANSIYAHDVLGKWSSASSGQGVLANAWDSNSSDNVTVSALDGSSLGHMVAGSYGDLWLHPDGSYQYLSVHPHAVRAAGGVAEDNFNFTVSDGTGGTTAETLSFLITSPQDHLVTGASGGSIQSNYNNAVLDGSAGGMDVSAGKGNHQVLFGGPGDTLVGNKHHDTFMFAPGLGQETIENFNAHDKIDLPASVSPDFHDLMLHVQGFRDSVAISFGNGDTITLVNFHGDLHAHNFHFML